MARMVVFTALSVAAGVTSAVVGRTAPLPSSPLSATAVPATTASDAARRDAAHEVPQIVARMDLKPGMTVGDLGAGTGYDTLRLAKVVGPGGRMIAEDVDPAALQVLGEDARREHLSNVVIALGEPQDPGLAPDTLDAAILIDMYHEVVHPYAFLFNLAGALKPGAPVGVEEPDRGDAALRTQPRLLRCEFGAVGYRLKSLAPMRGGLGYFAVFTAPSEPPPPQRIHACRS